MVAAINLKHRHPEYEVTLAEKNDCLGGRLYREQQGKHIINNGPSWYWMPDIIEDVMKQIGIDNPIDLMRLDPQCRMFCLNRGYDISGDPQELRDLIIRLDPTCGERYDRFLKDNEYKYNLAVSKYLKFRNHSLWEYASLLTPYHIYKLDMLRSYRSVINSISESEMVRQILEWPCLFIGKNPDDISGLFTFLTYSMIRDGTSVPREKGMITLIERLEEQINKLEIEVLKNHTLIEYICSKSKIRKTLFRDTANHKDVVIYADKYIAACDYKFNEELLQGRFRSYPKLFWEKQILCPSSIIFNIILDIKLPHLEYHNLFFDADLQTHMDTIYKTDKLPDHPLFYLNITTKHFKDAPEGFESLFILVPSNVNVDISEKEKIRVYNDILDRLSEQHGADLRPNITTIDCFSNNDFKTRFNAQGNNAYGLACDKYQIAFNRPKTKSRYLNNLYYTGQMTSPGPGVPPCMVSGLNVSNMVLEDIEEPIPSFFYRLMMAVTHILTLIFTLNINMVSIPIIFYSVKKEYYKLFYGEAKGVWGY